MRRLLVVTNIPTPYRVPLFNVLDAALRGAGWAMEVVFGSRGNTRRKWRIDDDAFRFPHTFLESRNLRLGPDRIVNTYAGLRGILEDRRPDGIVCTGYSAGTMAALRHGRRRGVPVAIWSGAVPRAAEQQWWRRIQRRWLVRRADRFLAYGTEAASYLETLGAPSPRVHIAWNTVDTARFEGLPGARAPGRGEPLRLVTVGYLERGKRIDLALRAVAQARARGLDVEMEVVGDGTARAALEAQSRELGLNGHVRFPGYREQGALRESLAGAHAFVFPTSHDIWGLVLVEAMAAGLPCLASTRAGATRDLVVEGETGFALDFEDTGAVVDRLSRLRDEPGRVASMGAAGRARIRDRFTRAHSSRGWLEMTERWS